MNIKRQKQIVALGKYIALAAVVGKLFSIPINIFVAKLLGPESYGVLSIVDTLMIYFSYTNLGILMNLERQIPIEKSSLSEKEIQDTYRTAFSNYSFTTLFSLLILIISFLLGVTFKTDGSFSIFLFIVFILITRNLNSFVSSFVKAEGEFDVYGKNSFLISIPKPLITLFFAYQFGLYGVLFALILINLSSVFYIFHLSSSVKLFSIRWNKEKTHELLGTGLKLFFGNKLESFLFTIGILLISNFGSIEDVGVYSFALTLISIRKFPFSKAISIVVSREMNVTAGEKGEKNFKEFYHFFQKNMAIYLLFVLLVLGTVLLTFTTVIEVYLPKYLKAIPLMFVFFGLVVIHSARLYSDYFFNATNQMFVKIKYTLLAIALSFSLGFFALHIGWGAFGIAISMISSIIITGLPQIYKAIFQVSGSKQLSLQLLFKLIGISLSTQVLIFYLSNLNLFDSILNDQFVLAKSLNLLASVFGYIVSCFILFELFFLKFKISSTTLEYVKNIFFKIKGDD